ncbi:MAG: permease-like cell division protein FtsX [Bacteroidales bacterium]|nr:permease-like cell division protein FtsX [Bacteroidales bacterium]
MKNDNSKIVGRRLVRSYLTSVISISLVLFLVAVACFAWINTSSISNYFKENSTVSVILKGDATEADAQALLEKVSKLGFVKQATCISREQGQKEMEELLGKGFLDVFESSPIPISLEVNLKSDYFSKDSLQMVQQALAAYPAVREVTCQESLVEAMNSNLDTIALVVAAVIALLLIISVALIANTVRLNIYSKRFTIHTMRLVGAKRSFIRKPFLRQAFWQGAIAAAIACGVFTLALYYAHSRIGNMFGLFSKEVIIPIYAIVFVAGILICTLTAAYQVNKLSDISKDDLYL